MSLNILTSTIRSNLGLLVRYAIVGATGAVIQTLTLYIWVTLAGLEEIYLVGAVVGFLLALFTSFILQKFWTFRDRVMHRTRRQFTWYGAVAVGNVLINVGVLTVAKWLFISMNIDFFNGWYLLVQISTVCFASGMSFLINYFFTFKGIRPELKPRQ